MAAKQAPIFEVSRCERERETERERDSFLCSEEFSPGTVACFKIGTLGLPGSFSIVPGAEPANLEPGTGYRDESQGFPLYDPS